MKRDEKGRCCDQRDHRQDGIQTIEDEEHGDQSQYGGRRWNESVLYEDGYASRVFGDSINRISDGASLVKSQRQPLQVRKEIAGNVEGQPSSETGAHNRGQY